VSHTGGRAAGRAGSLASLAIRSALSVLLLLSGVWGALALWFRAPLGGMLAMGFATLGLFTIVSVWRVRPATPFRWIALALWAGLFGALALWWGSIAPRHDRDWATALSRVPVATLDGDRLVIKHVRNFAWRHATASLPEQEAGSGEAIAEARWETRSVDLRSVSGVDLFFSYWTGPLIAHVLVSITFDDAPPLTFSVEIRRERGETYSALAGFFKSYELAIVVADEGDIVRLRTDIWREDVRLYRLDVSREKARALLLAYAREINRLSEAPRWYGTLSDNCTTVAYGLARELWPALGPDWRILLPGRAPEYAHELGALGTGVPFEVLKQRAAISEAARMVPAGADFSAWIRRDVPAPPR
jgi:hypothetical protein